MYFTPRAGLGVSNCRNVAEVIEAVQRAEQLGAEIAFLAEDVNCRDSFALCALSAVNTTTIKLGTGVVNPYTRNPTALAMGAATIDEVSDGRAVLGLGTSSPSLTEAQMGIPTGKPVRRMREATEIVRGLLAGTPVTYAGQEFRYMDAKLGISPVQRHLPIYFAAMGPLMLRLAGRLADGVLLNVGASVEYIAWAVRQIQEGARDAGRPAEDITIAAWLTVYVTSDYDAGLQRAREWLATMLSIPLQGEVLLEKAGFSVSMLPRIREHFGAYPHRGDSKRAAQFVPAEVAEALTIIGDRARVLTRLEEYRRAGVQVPVMSLRALETVLSRDEV